MLSLETLRQWLADEGEVLRSKKFNVTIKHHEMGSNPSACLQVNTNRFGGQLSVRVSGHADIDIMDFETKEFVVTKWCLCLIDGFHVAVLRQSADSLLKLTKSD